MKIVLTALIAILSMVTGATESSDPFVNPSNPVVFVSTSVPSTPTPQPGKTPQPQEFDVKGTIDAIQGDTITVDGKKITLGPGVQVEGQLKVGATVEIQGVLQPNGVLVVKEVDVEEDEQVEDDQEDEKGEEEHTDKQATTVKDSHKDKDEDNVKEKHQDKHEDEHEDEDEDDD